MRKLCCLLLVAVAAFALSLSAANAQRTTGTLRDRFSIPRFNRSEREDHRDEPGYGSVRRHDNHYSGHL